MKPLKEYMETSNRHVINVMAALISGTLASRDQLEQKLKTLYHLNIMSKLDDGLLIKNRVTNKLGSKQQQQQQLKDLPTHLRYQKTLNDFVASYLTSSSFGLLHDANIILVNLIRNYLSMKIKLKKKNLQKHESFIVHLINSLF